MIARLLTLIVIVTLALPIATLTSSGDPGQGSWSDITVEAKGKKHKKHAKKNGATSPVTTLGTAPQVTAVTRTIRQPVTQTFTSTQAITIPNGSAGTPANPYPSTIEVSGFGNGTITDVNLIFNGFTHTYPQDVDILLSRSDGRRALVMSDVGRNADVAAINLTLDDEAAAEMPGGQLESGTFRPTNLNASADTFDAPAPMPDGNVALSIFDGADPNETWQLWIMANEFGVSGNIGGGWALQITAEVDSQVQEQVQIAGDEPLPTDVDTKARKNGQKKQKGKRRR